MSALRKPGATPIMLTAAFGLPLAAVNTQIGALDRTATLMGSILSTGNLLSEDSLNACRTHIRTTIAHRDALQAALAAHNCADPATLFVAIDEARITLDPNPPAMTEREEFDLMVSQDIRMRHALDALQPFEDTARVHPEHADSVAALRQFLCRHIHATKHIVQSYL